MAHQIEAMTFVGETPWHGLGTKLDESLVYEIPAVIKAAGLDWDVVKVPVCTVDKSQITDHSAIRRVTDDRILGVVGPKYTPLQNRDAFDWFKPFLDAKQAQFHTAGSLFGGSRVWILAKLNRDPLVIAKGDEVDKYLLLSHSHDGSLAVRVGFTPVRVVCNNTLALAHGDKESQLIRIKHSREVVANLDAVRSTINAIDARFEATAEQYRLLVNKHINQKDVVKYVKLVFDYDVDDEKLTSRAKNIVDDILTSVYAGRGQTMSNIDGTAWQAYNGVTNYLSWNRGRTQDRRLDSLWFGEASKINDRALSLALEYAA